MSDAPVITVSDYIRKYGKLPNHTIKPQISDRRGVAGEGHGLRHREQALNRLRRLQAQKRKPLPKKLKIDHSLTGTKNYLQNRKATAPVAGTVRKGLSVSGSVREILKTLPENHVRGEKMTPTDYGTVKKPRGTFA